MRPELAVPPAVTASSYSRSCDQHRAYGSQHVSRIIPFFIRENPALAVFALLATASSGFGQTFFVGIFGAHLRYEFGLTNAQYGLTYSVATVLAALLLFRFGGLVDRWSLQRMTAVAVALVAFGCALMSGAVDAILLFVSFVLLRFGGQGLMGHIGITTAGRHFVQHRGKAMAFASTGFPLAEAVLPTLGALVVAVYGWRVAWLSGATLLMLVLLPLLLRLARSAPLPHVVSRDPAAAAGATRGEVLRDAGFYCLLPAVLASPFTITALFFHQGALASSKGWPTDVFAIAFVAFAVSHFISLFASGSLIDRIGAQRSLPLILLPMTGALALLAVSSHPLTPAVSLALLGFSQGGVNTAAGVVWPERYGIRHLGAIRSVAQGVMIISTALSPVLVGLLLDIDAGAGLLSGAMAAGVIGAAWLAWSVASAPRWHPPPERTT